MLVSVSRLEARGMLATVNNNLIEAGSFMPPPHIGSTICNVQNKVEILEAAHLIQ
jgi:hypothetical protein